ncbi:DNA/RNA helicase domain-containing protein [Cellulomonas sp. URHD0024]|uniref:DNA/RNA helicase domain-containing protein n=1 Tax=Cellulomonas sp. URHD0024 TaxID=1302620 RepID=UPI000422A824
MGGRWRSVRPGEMVSVAEIEAHAAARNLSVKQIDLHAQYRAGGSEAYLDWVLRLLGLRGDGPIGWRNEEAFTVEVADTAADLEAGLVEEIARGQDARITAAYCWPWSDPRSDGTLVPDVVIGDWQKPWNLRGERSVGGAPPSALWATGEGGLRPGRLRLHGPGVRVLVTA